MATVYRLGSESNEGFFLQWGRREVGAFQEQMPGGEAGRRNCEDERERGKTSQQLVLPAPGGFNEGTPPSGMELGLRRVQGAHGECGGARNSGAEEDALLGDM